MDKSETKTIVEGTSHYTAPNFGDKDIMMNLDAVYVIPGGGRGHLTTNNRSHYPEWTSRRTYDAFVHYDKNYGSGSKVSEYH